MQGLRGKGTNRRWWLGLALAATVWATGCSDDAASGKSPAKTATDAAQGGDSSDGSALPADGTATSSATQKLTIGALDPAQGRTSGGETVTITGTGFASTVSVLFGGTPLQADAIFVVDSQTLQITTPPHEAGLVSLQVSLPGASAGDPPITAKLDNAFLYFNDLVLTKVEPGEGPVAGGTPIAIAGTGLSGKTQVLIGGKPAIGVQVVGDDQVLCTTPPGLYGPQPVHVVNQRGAGLLKNGFFYTAAPTITSLSPSAGPTLGGSPVSVYGTGLDKNTQLRFGEALATITEVGKGYLKVVTPPGQGAVDVTAKSKYGQAILAGGYVYLDDAGTAATKILSIAPASGPLGGGGQVVIVATGLIAASDTTVLIGSKTAEIVSVSAADHAAIVRAPKAATAGAVDVTVMTGKGSDTKKQGYAYTDSLALVSIAPASGPPEGNTKVVLKGSGFAKGPVTVKIGALPASAVAVVSDSEIQAVTPKGSPGYADVAVAIGAEKAVLKGAYTYTAKDLQLYVPYPATGAQAGGTLVQIYGSGFVPGMEVRFGGNLATHFSFVDSGHVAVKTPPGKVGAADVEVSAGGLKSILAKGYTYFNPMSAYGGTWGSGVDGAINLTVLDAKSGAPVADAFAMLWTSPATPYQGYTNADGQITFSGDDIFGKQMVSASKTGYESASIVLFDASNVTLLMTPIPPPSPGSPPPGTPPPTVSGKVVGLDKYVFVPVGSCSNAQAKGQTSGGVCNSCTSDASCGGSDLSCIDIGGGNGKRCVKSCAAGCGTGFKCYAFGDVGACAPTAGDLTAVCYHSKDTILSQDNYPPEGAGFEATPAKNYKYKIITSMGEQAIVCFGGYKQPGAALTAGDATSMQAFTATVMGVRRHLMVVPGEKFENIDVFLNIPLTAKANVRLDRPPVWPVGQTSYGVTAAWAYLVFGGDGAIKMPNQDQKFIAPFQDTDPDKLEIAQLPSALAGDIHDASLSMLGLDVEIRDNGTQVPVSITIKNGIKELGNDAMLRRLAGSDFEAVPTGVPKNIYGLWGAAKDDLYAVGAAGTLVHWNGGGWTVQASPVAGTADLHGIFGTDAKHAWLVGWNGAMAAFDGLGWQVLPMLSGTANLNSVFASPKASGGHDVWVAASSGLYRVVNNGGQPGLQKYNPSPYGNYLGIHGSDADHVWAVGMYGSAAMWDGNVWKSQASGTSIALRSVWAAGPADAFAVGESGQILRYDGQAWKSMSSPTTQTLYSVWGSNASDVWAAGAAGVLLHFDGKKWTKQNVGKVDKNLLAVWSTAAGDVVSMGEQELLLGPMLYPPLAVNPKEDGNLQGNSLEWQVDPSWPEPHFNYVTIGIPGMGGDTPVWNIMTKGSVTKVDLPDFPTIQGTPGIPKGTPLHLTVIRGYKEGFDIDHYDMTDLDTLSWRSWALHSYMFVRP